METPVSNIVSDDDHSDPQPPVHGGGSSSSSSSTKRPRTRRVRNCLFTSFKLDYVVHPEILLERLKADEAVKYCIFQLERAPTTDTLHIQGYLECNKACSIDNFQSIIGDTCHIDPRRGTASQARAYCSKTETRVVGPFEHGVANQQGRRTDLEAIAKRVVEGATLREVALESPVTFVQNSTGLLRLAAVTGAERDPDFRPKVRLFIGIPGAGKTRDARDLLTRLHGVPPYCKTAGQKWFAGYTNQKGVILDEYSGSTLPWGTFLQLTDRGCWRVEDKGTSVPFLATDIVITSNYLPDTWYQKDGINILALYRRLDAVRIYHGMDLFFELLNDPESIRDRDGIRLRDEVVKYWNYLINNPEQALASRPIVATGHSGPTTGYAVEGPVAVDVPITPLAAPHRPPRSPRLPPTELTDDVILENVAKSRAQFRFPSLESLPFDINDPILLDLGALPPMLQRLIIAAAPPAAPFVLAPGVGLCPCCMDITTCDPLGLKISAIRDRDVFYKAVRVSDPEYQCYSHVL